MLYYSELEGKKVFTEDKIKIGILKDIIFTPSDQAKITKLVVRGIHQDMLILPVTFIKKINTHIYLQKSFQIAELEENELFIRKNLLDKQIIDISGNKVVRVNDVIIQDTIIPAFDLKVAGVDVGWLGLMRRLKLEVYFSRLFHKFKIKHVSDFLSWADIQPLDLARGKVRLKKEEEKLENLRPEDLADHLEQTNEKNIRKFLKILDPKFAVEVISNLNLKYQRDLFVHWSAEKCASILQKMDPDEGVDILLTLSRKKRENILLLVEAKKRSILSKLILLSKTPLGKRVTPVFFTVNSSATVKDTLQKLKNETADFDFLSTIYIVNNNKQLVGVLNLRELVMLPPETNIYKHMIQNIIVATLLTPVEIVIRKMLRYHLPAIPVVDSNKEMVGIVTFDDVADIILKRMYPNYG